MKDCGKINTSDFRGLPNISIRQLEVFRTICQERSYTNAALELRSTRANIKRVCDEFEQALGHRLFEEDAEKSLVPTAFAKGMLTQMTPLSRTLRQLGEGVRSMHESGRVLRFAASSEFFGGGLFTEFLSRLQIKDLFRLCFLKIDTKRFRTALLNAECDVYFGIGLVESDRLDVVDLGPVPWRTNHAGEGVSRDLKDLQKQKWKLVRAGEPGSAERVVDALSQVGVTSVKLTDAAKIGDHPDDLVLQPDLSVAVSDEIIRDWPGYRFSAIMRKHHPYSELKALLADAARR